MHVFSLLCLICFSNICRPEMLEMRELISTLLDLYVEIPLVTGGVSPKGIGSAEPCCFLLCYSVLTVEQSIKFHVMMKPMMKCDVIVV